MRLSSGVRRVLAVAATVAAFPAFAVVSRALSADTGQHPPMLNLPPLLQRLGLKLADRSPVALKAGERVRATVVDPRKLAAFGIRSARAGDVAWVTAQLPAAREGDRAAAERAHQQATQAADAATQAATAGLDAGVSVETTDAAGRKKTQTTTVPGAPATGIPTTAE